MIQWWKIGIKADMREKNLTVIITFVSTTQAMLWRAEERKQDLKEGLSLYPEKSQLPVDWRGSAADKIRIL